MQTKSFHRKINSQLYKKCIETEAEHQLFVTVHAATSATSINSADHSRTPHINFMRSMHTLHTMSAQQEAMYIHLFHPQNYRRNLDDTWHWAITPKFVQLL
jgi:hypothetical protein